MLNYCDDPYNTLYGHNYFEHTDILIQSTVWGQCFYRVIKYYFFYQSPRCQHLKTEICRC